MAEEKAPEDARARLEELFPSCATDCTDGCKYGCLGWLHRFDPPTDDGHATPESFSGPYSAPNVTDGPGNTRSAGEV